jgi:arsenite methyltransferase
LICGTEKNHRKPVYNFIISMNQLVRPIIPCEVIEQSAPPAGKAYPPESLFERFAGIYIFCRERIFRDDTSRIIRRIWQNNEPAANSFIIELGCGPGFYARTLAARYPKAFVLGIDDSQRQLDYARVRAMEAGLRNCTFKRDNVLNLDQANDSVDLVIASRLFTVLPERECAVAEMFRVLNSGGKCFVAEPRYAFSASIPLLSMRLLARLSGYFNRYREPTRATALTFDDFCALFATQRWARLETWRRGRYQYALGEKV